MSALEPALYALGAVLYAAHFVRRQPALGQAATGALGAGVVVHTFLLGMATVRESALPLVGAHRTRQFGTCKMALVAPVISAAEMDVESAFA